MAELDNYRRLVIKALFSDDDLMDIFVLKGGNALNIAYSVNDRASIDIDISMAEDFTDIDEIKRKIENALVTTFAEEKITVFDIELQPRPMRKNMREENAFWGGYRLNFKLINNERRDVLRNNLEAMRREAIIVNSKNHRVFKVDISKYEVCKEKEAIELDGILIYVYTPTMIIYEKLRAICQQMEEYRQQIETITPTPRARDFFDIYTIFQHWGETLDLYSPKNLELLKEIFEIKKVDLRLLNRIKDPDIKEFHRDSFNAVRDTVSIREVKEYDFYYEFTCKIVEKLNECLYSHVKSL
ncbi:MAG TPA: nucleotidyl transferase AbiEii/AbiGii toxin family protein [Bacillota bacterium]|nr:nucleotidyl transferase AbiEii/AbiGii toxin family protein [Bacillota bacterium]HPT86229.1 nucleotidyl transferase AbiEii/AbiGii toxin family protein [Bacillota bacterium]